MEKNFERDELKRAFEMIRQNSAPGLDGIKYKMLQDMPEEIQEYLLKIYNKICNTELFPNSWRKYQVIFIDKAKKEKVRSIALSSCVGKLMERMVNERLVWWAERENILANQMIKIDSEEVNHVQKS